MKTISDVKNYSTGRRAMNVLRLASDSADGETITIGRDVYEIDTAANPGAVTAGNIRVNCNAGVTPTITSAALVAAINASNTHKLTAVAISINEVLVYTNDSSSPLGLACAETLAGANSAWAAAAMYGGRAAGFRASEASQRAIVAQEVALGTAHFLFPFTPAGVLVQVRTAAGLPKAWGGALAVTGGRVTLTNNGTTDFAATDVVALAASV